MKLVTFEAPGQMGALSGFIQDEDRVVAKGASLLGKSADLPQGKRADAEKTLTRAGTLLESLGEGIPKFPTRH